MEQVSPPSPQSAAALYAAFDTDPTPIVEFLVWLAAEGFDFAAPRLLDVGCGVGRLLPPLTRRGWRVLGLEPDPEYRELAAARASELGAEVRSGGFADIARVVAGEPPFDLVAAINGSFAYLATPADRMDALAQCRSVLRPGGFLVIDLPHLLRILFEYAGPGSAEREVDGRLVRLTRRHRVDYPRALFITDERFDVRERDGSTWALEREHPYAITTYPELADQLERAGFGRLRTFTAFTARTPEPIGAGRMLIVAQAS
jgi:SAM-dependent methyltransferase